MTRGPYYRTLKRNERIVALFLDEMSPKEIRQHLNLPSVWIVYKVLKKFHGEQLRQTPPIIAKEIANTKH
jgi:hypothetical protein